MSTQNMMAEKYDRLVETASALEQQNSQCHFCQNNLELEDAHGVSIAVVVVGAAPKLQMAVCDNCLNEKPMTFHRVESASELIDELKAYQDSQDS